MSRNDTIGRSDPHAADESKLIPIGIETAAPGVVSNYCNCLTKPFGDLLSCMPRRRAAVCCCSAGAVRSVCLSVCLSVGCSVCLSVCVSVCRLSVLSVCLSVGWSGPARRAVGRGRSK